MKSITFFTPLLLIILSLSACKDTDSTPLPILGLSKIIDGDTVDHFIPDFKFINQDSAVVTNESFDDQIYISDFFFMSCPAICPKVMKQMLRLYEQYKDNDKIRFVSHTLDPKRDTPERLKMYAQNLGVDTDKWLFLTGDKDHLYDMTKEYFVAAFEDAEAPGGFNHSGKIILVDVDRHVRAFAEGTDPDDVTDLFKDIDKLLREYETK